MTIKALHGSKSGKIFKNFSLDTKISNPVSGMDNISDNKLGIFLTDNMVMAEFFAGIQEFSADESKYVSTGKRGIVYQCRFELKNPLIIEEKEFTKYEDSVQKYFALLKLVGGSKNLRDKLLAEGYDGIIIKDATTHYYIENSTYNIYVVLNPNVIKIEAYNKY